MDNHTFPCFLVIDWVQNYPILGLNDCILWAKFTWFSHNLCETYYLWLVDDDFTHFPGFREMLEITFESEFSVNVNSLTHD